MKRELAIARLTVAVILFAFCSTLFGGGRAAERLGLFDKTAVFAEAETVSNPETRVDIGIPKEILIAGENALCFLDGMGSQKEGLFISSLGDTELVWNKVSLDGMEAPEGALRRCALSPSPNGELFMGMLAEIPPQGDQTRIYKSLDNGEDWVLLNGGNPIEYFPAIYDLAVDPNNHQRIYAAGPLCDGYEFYRGGLVESLDGGENWNPLFNDFLDSPDSVIVHPENSDLYVADDSTWGIYKGERQIDGSFVWSKIFACGAPDDLRLHPQNPEVMVFRYDNRVIFTEDRGETWDSTSIEDVEGKKNKVRSLAFGPDGRLWIGTGFNKLYFTTDRRSLVLAGEAEKKGLPSGEFTICSIAVNPANSNELLIGLGEHGPYLDTVWKAVYHSKDGGENWRPANNFKGGPFRIFLPLVFENFHR